MMHFNVRHGQHHLLSQQPPPEHDAKQLSPPVDWTVLWSFLYVHSRSIDVVSLSSTVVCTMSSSTQSDAKTPVCARLALYCETPESAMYSRLLPAAWKNPLPAVCVSTAEKLASVSSIAMMSRRRPSDPL